jgi:hypothetical protein
MAVLIEKLKKEVEDLKIRLAGGNPLEIKIEE